MKVATREAYGKTLAALAKENKNIIVLDADLSGSTKTKEVKAVAPEQHYNMGIAEGNMMAVAAGQQVVISSSHLASPCLRLVELLNKFVILSVIHI